MKTIYEFGPGRADGTGDMKDVLGGKGAGLADMCRKKLPVPPGFTIATTVCPRYYAAGKRVSKDVVAGTKKAVIRLEKEQGRGFGDPARPLCLRRHRVLRPCRTVPRSLGVGCRAAARRYPP